MEPAAKRVCVEFLAPAELARPEVVRLLARHRVAPMLALRPGTDDEALAALDPFLEAGLPACGWPLLDDADGYWPSEANAGRFVERVRGLLARAARRGRPLPWLAVDLEPPIDEVSRARRSGPWWRAAPALAAQALAHLRPAQFAAAQQDYVALHKECAAAGTRTLAIAYPLVSADFAAGGDAMQDLCEAPLRCGWDRVAIMTYGSMVAGYSRGALSVADARWYGYRALSRLSRALGARTGAFVGVVGRGKLGDEPAYDSPDDLGLDAAAARAAGVGEVALFCLEGILDSRDPEAWLRALDRPAARPPATWRGELLHRSIEAGARAVAVARAAAQRSGAACAAAAGRQK